MLVLCIPVLLSGGRDYFGGEGINYQYSVKRLPVWGDGDGDRGYSSGEGLLEKLDKHHY